MRDEAARNPGGLRRLVYGEIVDGRYTFAWDSPLVSGTHPALTFEDVDGDGVKEIFFTTSIGRRDENLVSIFTRTGVELTRQDDCVTEWGDNGDESRAPATACPVVGVLIDLQPPVRGRRDLLVETADDESYRLVLRGKRYIRAGRPPVRDYRSPTAFARSLVIQPPVSTRLIASEKKSRSIDGDAAPP